MPSTSTTPPAATTTTVDSANTATRARRQGERATHVALNNDLSSGSLPRALQPALLRQMALGVAQHCARWRRKFDCATHASRWNASSGAQMAPRESRGQPDHLVTARCRWRRRRPASQPFRRTRTWRALLDL